MARRRLNPLFDSIPFPWRLLRTRPAEPEPEPDPPPPAEPDGLSLLAPSVEAPVKVPRAEVRFGLVLYGGVSLAIYIYGVVYEFWRLVCASEGRQRNAYSHLLARTKVTATVDIVSGTSAGGINGILLAKALTTGASLRKVRDIWTDEANLRDLLHKRSDLDPRSLLRTDRFEQLLSDGLASMDRPVAEQAPLVRAFDLFVSSTRLQPWIRDFPTDLGGAIQTADYRKAFRLKYRVEKYNPKAKDLGYEQSDFAPEHNPTLVQLARATSAFPGAFEPRLMKRDDAKRLYRPSEPEETYFSDGGILHNKPFTETISTIVGRANDLPLDRWLVSVEPDPESFAAPSVEEPQVDDVISKAVFGIPRYQSIAADLDLLVTMRERARRERVLLKNIDAEISRELEASDEPIARIARRFPSSPTYGAYRIERAYQLSSDLGVAIGDAAGLDEPRTRAVIEALQAGLQSADEAEVEGDYSLPDTSFERRRIYYLLGRVNRRPADGTAEPAGVRDLIQVLWARYDAISAAIWEALHKGATGSIVANMPDRDTDWIRASVLDLIPTLRGALVGAVPAPGSDEDPEPVDLGPAGEAAEASVASLCLALDGLLELAPASRLGYLDIYRHYELWDQFLLPCDPNLGVAPRDDIQLARISPEDASYISKTAKRKVAGDALFHFGGFLKKEWRTNDILWGRLDAAENIVRMLSKGRGLSDEVIDKHIRDAQLEVVAEDLPEALPHYRHYLENTYATGEEGLGDVPMADRARLGTGAADVVRNMLGGLAKARAGSWRGQIYRWIGAALGFVLMLLRWPVRAIWGADRGLKRFASLVVLFIGAWTVATFVLALTGVIEEKSNLWALLGIGALIYLTYGALLLAFERRKLPLLVLIVLLVAAIVYLVTSVEISVSVSISS